MKRGLSVIALMLTLFFSFTIFLPQKANAADLYTIFYNRISSRNGNAAESDWIAQALLYASATYDVDPILLCSVMETESNYNFNSFSHAGAIGLMQLMPDTANSIGVNPYDPLGNVMGGALHLKTLINSFSGWGTYGVTYAVAAYNAGSQAVRDYGGVPPFAETQNYVVKVNRIYMSILSQLQ